MIKYNSQNIRNVNIINGIKLGDKPYKKTNLKPINEDRRRIGGGGRFWWQLVMNLIKVLYLMKLTFGGSD